MRLPIAIQDLGDQFEFFGLIGAYLYELWKYHQRVRSDLKSSLLGFRIFGLPADVKRLRCEVLDSSDLVFDKSLPRWLGRYIESIADSPRLFDPIAFENDWAHHIKETTAISSKT